MRNGDGGGLDPRLEERLREELDRVQPRFSSPRYLSAHRRPAILRAAPAVLAATLLAMLGLTAYAGSANPSVVIEKVVNVVHPQASPSPPIELQTSTPTQTPEHHQSPEPSEKPEPSGSPEPAESPDAHHSPEPSDGHESPEPSDGGGGE